MAKLDQPLDLRMLIEAVEEAPPLDAVDVLAAMLAEMVGATHVSLLIADFSGSAVSRILGRAGHHPSRANAFNGAHDNGWALGSAG